MPTLFVPNEPRDGETRCAASPDSVRRLIKAGWSVHVEKGAGERSFIEDGAFEDAGAKMVDGVGEADAIARVSPPFVDEVKAMPEGAVLCGFILAHKNAEAVRELVSRKISTLAMELVPRTTRAQTMDALSSQASVAGYKAVILAAAHVPKYFPLMMTAAGTVQPARVVVLGAGVAGLQAIATARRLGAIVEVSDIRPAVEEEVRSLGARFIPLPEMGESGVGEGGYARAVSKEFLEKQRAIVTEHLRQADAVITTAQVPGRPAPRLVSADMVAKMKRGAVIVDLAASEGGNCELTVAGEIETVHGVTIIGHRNLPATAPVDATPLYARNVQALLQICLVEGQVTIDTSDEIISGSLMTHAGEITHAPTRKNLEGEAK